MREVLDLYGLTIFHLSLSLVTTLNVDLNDARVGGRSLRHATVLLLILPLSLCVLASASAAAAAAAAAAVAVTAACAVAAASPVAAIPAGVGGGCGRDVDDGDVFVSATVPPVPSWVCASEHPSGRRNCAREEGAGDHRSELGGGLRGSDIRRAAVSAPQD